MIKNKQKRISNTFWILAVIAAIILILTFTDGSPVYEAFALSFIAIFLVISFVVIALVFRNRAKKMRRLLDGGALIDKWTLDKQQLAEFVNTLYKERREKSKALIVVIGILFVIVTIPFLFILEDEIGLFLLIIGSAFAIILFSSIFFPWYYKVRNLKGDGQVLIGAKYIYINGFFHNWDYPLSGLNKIKTIKKPFHGIHLSYYYTDRTLRHSHEIKIPVPEGFSTEDLISKIKNAN